MVETLSSGLDHAKRDIAIELDGIDELDETTEAGRPGRSRC
jgi:hypothetical protein